MDSELQYFPAVLRSEHDSPIDALVALGLPREECMELVAASWGRPELSLLAWVDGGRAVAVLPLAEGRWAACNAFVEQSCREPKEALRRAGKLAKRGRRALVGVWAGAPAGTMAG
ncbi:MULTISPECIES: hypothetical protein [Azospira]|jgi:hypothetical protein|uniref:hypothetical protein n=1 Tax=Azospira TaxID=146937 RepID=UPI0012605B44|nr:MULTISPECIES: hypothetical protein [Azospira]MBP7490301.1 hypothetical protein [Azospira sp.]BBN89087.1 hypothetical protein AZSP09_21100 [Azospira sp. I09]